MTIENVYSYLEYLALTVDQLADAVAATEGERAVYEARLAELESALVSAQKDVDMAEARAALAEGRIQQAEEKSQELAVMVKTLKTQQKNLSAGQPDLFAPPPVAAPAVAPSQPVQNPNGNKVANDENALILAKKLDSTIDKVQRLIREAARA